ncbi:reticulon-3-like [Dysidea avara]|uniref:reticulon-3-like n=1 Tax=Dysidea avara TaxID=196820 RepID=UPI0033340B57
MENDPTNESEGYIEVDNETASSSKEPGDVHQSAHSESVLDSPSDATMMTECTSGSSVEDIPSSRSSDDSHPRGYMSFLNALDQDVLEILYWRKPQKTGAMFGFTLLFLLAVGMNPFLHTVVLLLLASMVVSLLYCVGMVLWNSFYNRPVENPFKEILQRNTVVSQEAIIQVATTVAEKIDYWSLLLFQLILFHNVKASLKFGVVMWILSYITPYLTLILALFFSILLLFTVPKLYEVYETEINRYIGLAHDKVNLAMQKVQTAIPGLGKSKEE